MNITRYFFLLFFECVDVWYDYLVEVIIYHTIRKRSRRLGYSISQSIIHSSIRFVYHLFLPTIRLSTTHYPSTFNHPPPVTQPTTYSPINHLCIHLPSHHPTTTSRSFICTPIYPSTHPPIPSTTHPSIHQSTIHPSVHINHITIGSFRPYDTIMSILCNREMLSVGTYDGYNMIC